MESLDRELEQLWGFFQQLPAVPVTLFSDVQLRRTCDQFEACMRAGETAILERDSALHVRPRKNWGNGLQAWLFGLFPPLASR